MSNWDNLLKLANQSCLATFGVPVVYTPALDGTPINLQGVFDEKRDMVSLMGDGLDAVVPQAVVEIRISDLGVDPISDDQVTIDGLTYRILDVQLDGKGMAQLHLVRT